MPEQSRPGKTGVKAGSVSASPVPSLRLRFAQIFSLLLGVFGAAVILLRSPHAAGFLAPPDSSNPTVQDIRSLNSSDARQRLSRMEQPGGLRSQPVEPGPLWVANLACRVGDYVVSVRRVRIPHYTWDDNPPFTLAMPVPPPLYLSLQVMATHPGSLRQIVRVADDFTVTDSAGQRLKSDVHQDFAFPNGRGCRFTLTPTNAAFLRRVDGVITLAGSGGRLPFHIENVPVPWTPHVFGLVGAAILSGPSAAAPRPPGPRPRVHAGDMRPVPPSALTVSDPAQVETILQHMPQAAFEAPDLRLPNRLVMQAGASSPTLLPLPRENDVPSAVSPLLECALTAQPTTDGEIITRIQLAPKGMPLIRQSVSVWDNSPLLLALPARLVDARAPADARLVIYLHLCLDSSPPSVYIGASTPRQFMAGKGERGGVLAGRVTTSGGAFDAGYAALSLERVSNSGEAAKDVKKDAKQGGIEAGKGAAKLNAPLDREGRFTLSNLAAGTYRIVLEQVQPAISYAAIKGAPEAYMQHRWHIAHPVVENDVQTAIVHPGGHTALAEWIYQEK